jgi:hypothetical protein
MSSNTRLHPLAGHFGWEFLTQLQAQPTYNCTSAHSTYPFANYRGGLAYADLSNKTLYTTGSSNSTYGYYPQVCSTSNQYICEVPQSNWRCPPSPPAPPPAPVSCLPQDTEFQVCNVTRGSCYRYQTGGAAITTHRTTCSNSGGYLVAWNSYEEQREVENYFTGGSAWAPASHAHERCVGLDLAAIKWDACCRHWQAFALLDGPCKHHRWLALGRRHNDHRLRQQRQSLLPLVQQLCNHMGSH